MKSLKVVCARWRHWHWITWKTIQSCVMTNKTPYGLVNDWFVNPINIRSGNVSETSHDDSRQHDKCAYRLVTKQMIANWLVIFGRSYVTAICERSKIIITCGHAVYWDFLASTNNRKMKDYHDADVSSFWEGLSWIHIFFSRILKNLFISNIWCE